ncbi:MAG: gliding motility-associated C-terminal domain-containing protein [Bacteroidetes bacterium]|nr:gliding motility-associated C-terminal domain-containing protein [Bacteroidota bacterium]
MTVNPVLPVSVSITADATTICAGTTVNFTATPANEGLTPSYQWKLNGTNAGTNSTAYSYAPVNGDVVTVVLTSSETCQSGGPATSTAINMIVNPILPVSVSVTADANPACVGATVNFTANPTNGGLTPSYQWKVNGTNAGINSDTYAYVPVTGDLVTVILTSSETCQSGGPAISPAVTMTVNPVLPSSVSITADATTICAGTTVTFTATPVNEGTPTYQWYNGAVPVGTNSSTFSSNTLANTDNITVVMTSSLTCVTGSPATSNIVAMTVNPVLPVSVSVAADANPVCAGTTVNFTATPTNGGLTPAYQWKVNGINAGTNSTAYSYAPVNGDVVTVVLTSSETCQSSGPATSPAVNMTVNPVLPVSVSIAADANPVCAGTTVNFTATPANGGLTPSYQWKVNGTNAGINSATYSYIPVNGDVVTVDLTSSETCQSGGPATSNSINMIVSSAPVVTSTQVDVLCKTAATGSIDITLTGGTTPYTYSWTGNGVTASSEDQNGLTAGTYSVIVTDAAGCTSISYSFTITEPAVALTGSITSQTNVLVFGGSNGSVTVAGAGGTGAYQYKLGTGAYQASGTFGSLTGGDYTVTVQDANLCTFDVAFTITQPSAPLSVSIASQTNVSCFGTSTGSVTAAGAGGSTPYEYSLDGGAFQSSTTFASLAAGTYTITARDAASITATVGVTITQPASAIGGFLVSHTDILCFGSNTGVLTVNGTGGTGPYLYRIGSGSYQASGTFTDLIAGTYTVTVQDANLCTFGVTADITQPSAAVSGTIMVQTNVSCHGGGNGSVTIVGAGGTAPYEYNISGGTFQTSGLFSSLAAGNYTIVVRDANLCFSNVTVTVTEPEVLALDHTTVPASCPNTPDGSISLTITGGTAPYNAIWSDGLSGISRTNIPDGSYSVVVTDVNGCAASLVIELENTGSADCVVAQEILTPNNDGFNDTWKIRNIELFPDAEVLVFTRWGKLVYKSKNISDNEWDGTFNGKQLPTDSYHYILHLNDGSKPRSGVISIIR